VKNFSEFLALSDNVAEDQRKMLFRRLVALISVLALLTSCVVAQDNSKDNLFTITVAAPTLAKDVQVRYFLSGEFQGFYSSTTANGKGTKIVIRTDHESKAATGFKAIAYAPGCQFVTISVDDLSATRDGDFQCQKLPTTLLQGRVPVSALQGKDLQIEVLYVCDWAPQFFNIGRGAVSPFVLVKVAVATDGTFSVDMPDFAADPLWSSLSNEATLRFYLVDPGTGGPVNELAAPAEFAQGHNLKVATSYPGELQFTVLSTSAQK